MPDYYAVLGLTRQATSEEIHAAYRRLARLYHPDVNPAPAAALKMKALNAAYAVLGDAARRAEFDRTPFGKAGLFGPAAGAAGPPERPDRRSVVHHSHFSRHPWYQSGRFLWTRGRRSGHWKLSAAVVGCVLLVCSVVIGGVGPLPELEEVVRRLARSEWPGEPIDLAGRPFDLAAPVVSLPDAAAMPVTLVRPSDHFLTVVTWQQGGVVAVGGTTNVPDGSQLAVFVRAGGPADAAGASLARGEAVVRDGRYRVLIPLPAFAGQAMVQVLFLPNRQVLESVRVAVGPWGENLRGPLVRSEPSGGGRALRAETAILLAERP